jgi:hypothetical protein
LSDVEIEKRLDAIVRLFCCLHGRDTFMASYTNLLALRLLNNTSVSNEAEELMIKKLQVECGHNTVNRIKTMFQDMMKSKDVIAEFKKTQNYLKLSKDQDIDFTAEILTSGHWPYQDVPKCKIPRQLGVMKDGFSQFYKNKFQNREIAWLYNHGSVNVATNYLNKKYQLVVNVFQTAILCLFNSTDSLTYGEIKERC